MMGMKCPMVGAAIGLAGIIAILPVTDAMAQTPADMLVVAARIGDITTLDPAESVGIAGNDISRNVYGNLVSFDPLDLSKGYEPDLAESWEVSADGRTITFTLRQGVKFHSGNPVTAEDAEFSLRRAVILGEAPSYILTQFGFTPENAKDTIVAEGDTLRLTTDKKYAVSFVLNSLTAAIGGIVDKKLVMANAKDGDLGNGWLKTNSAGSGPYKIAGWKPGEMVTLAANTQFYKGAPAMSRVIVRHVQESTTQRLLLERGDIDVARNLNPEDIAGVTGKDGVTVDRERRGRLLYISLNQKNPNLSKPKVIEAIKSLIDYKGMQDSFLNGQYQIHQAFLPRTYLGDIADNPYALNVEKAKVLLKDANVGSFEINAGVRDAQGLVEIAQSLQSTFAKAGITLNIAIGTGEEVLTRYRARELDLYIGARDPDYPDPQTNAGTFAYNPDNSDEARATGLLAWRNAWDPGDMNEAVLAAVVEGDRDKRRKMYEDLQRQHQKRSPFAILFQKIEQIGRRDRVKNLKFGGAVTAASYWPVTK